MRILRAGGAGWVWLGILAVAVGAAEEAAPEAAVGNKAPDFEATDVNGKTVKLSEFLGQRNVVLVFSRAHWCPFCMGHARQLQQRRKEFQELGADIVAVYRENREGAAGLKKVAEASGAEFTLLNDPRAANSSRYSQEGFDAYVIDKEGVIRAAVQGTKPKRPEIDTLLAEVKKLQ